MAREIRVGIADRHELFRVALAHLLSDQDGFRVIGEAEDGPAAVQLAVGGDPDVLLLDPDLPLAAGLETIRKLREARPHTEIVVLTDLQGEEPQRRAFEAGVRGYLLKDGSLRQVLDAVRAAAQGEYFLAGRPGEELIADYVRGLVGGQPPGGRITPRERELACLLADGYSSKEAADVLGIAVKTAETHRASLMRKLGARNVVDIVKYCVRNRLIEID
jgi:DNA-binding NarL/FixJ family response regulator